MQDSTMKREKSYPEQQRTIGALLRIPFQKLADTVYDELAEISHNEIRPAHSVVFRYILDKGSRITELAEQAGMTKQSMAALVDHLHHYGYVQIQPDPNDGRAKQVVLTQRGKKIQQQAMALSQQMEQQWAELIGKEEMATLRHLLEKLYDQLEESAGPQ